MATEQAFDDKLLVAALNRTAWTLKPYPAGADLQKIDEAVARLRAAGFVHGGRREPNLTRAGVERARELAARRGR